MLSGKVLDTREIVSRKNGSKHNFSKVLVDPSPATNNRAIVADVYGEHKVGSAVKLAIRDDSRGGVKLEVVA